MLLKIDFESELPIYEQLKNQIITAIAKGDLKPEESLPSVRQLAEDIGINMHTVNKAYAQLRNHDFIKMDRRKGAVVNTQSPRVDPSYMANLHEQLNPVIAEACCRGLAKEDFFNLCSAIFNDYENEEGVKK